MSENNVYGQIGHILRSIEFPFERYKSYTLLTVVILTLVMCIDLIALGTSAINFQMFWYSEYIYLAMLSTQVFAEALVLSFCVVGFMICYQTMKALNVFMKSDASTIDILPELFEKLNDIEKRDQTSG